MKINGGLYTVIPHGVVKELTGYSIQMSSDEIGLHFYVNGQEVDELSLRNNECVEICKKLSESNINEVKQLFAASTVIQGSHVACMPYGDSTDSYDRTKPYNSDMYCRLFVNQ